MVPDFSQLRKQERDRNLSQGQCDTAQSAKPSDSQGADHLKSSQQFNKPPTSSPAKRRRHRKKKPKGISSYIQEACDDFLALWPHRFDYLFAPHPDPGTKPDWQTESRYPLPDRLIKQGSNLFGVRPGPTTTYLMLDLDKSSPYHPQRDPLVFERISAALEPLGLVTDLKLTSSDNDGVHDYYPLGKEVSSWQLGLTATTLLENAGFKVRPGWLEVFPNRKPFSTDGSISLFNGHRLPLQQGSYLLNDDLQPVSCSQLVFVRHWQQAAARNDVSAQVLKQTVRQAQRQTYRVTGKAEKFLNDLNAEVELGWTEKGQTNRLLGRITMRSFIFGHILHAESPLSGQALVDDIVRIARSLPGFKDFCGHQQELLKRAQEWARSIQNSRYFPYGSGKAVKQKTGPSWNEQQHTAARERIQQALISLFRQNALPDKTTPRFKLLCTYGISGETLYDNKELWHPKHISEQQKALIETPPDPPLQVREEAACTVGAAASSKATSLLGGAGRNKPTGEASGNQNEVENGQNRITGCNFSRPLGSEPIETVQGSPFVERTAPPQQLVLEVHQALQRARAVQQAQREQNRQQYEQEKRQKAQAAYEAKLQNWLASGDPILVAEAEQVLSRRAQTSSRN